MKTLTLLCVLVSAVAFADDKRVSVPVGYSTTVELPANVTRVILSDPSIVDIRRNGRKLTFTGQKQGSSSAIVQTADGKTRLAVYVASDKYALPY